MQTHNPSDADEAKYLAQVSQQGGGNTEEQRRLRDVFTAPTLATDPGMALQTSEMQVASLVKDGKTSKEIADVLNVSETTVNFHRKNLRVKFGLTNQRTNLRSYLLSIS